MKDKFSTRDIAQWKSIFKLTDSMEQKASKLKTKINQLQNELDKLEDIITCYETPMLNNTGFKSHDLIEKVVEPYLVQNPITLVMEPKLDKDGRPLTKTIYKTKFSEETNYLPTPVECNNYKCEDELIPECE